MDAKEGREANGTDFEESATAASVLRVVAGSNHLDYAFYLKMLFEALIGQAALVRKLVKARIAKNVAQKRQVDGGTRRR